MVLSDSQKWLLLAGVGGFGFLLYLLSPILMPFFAAALLAYLGDPIADRLEARRVPRTVAVIIVFVTLLLLALLLLLLLIPMLENQLSYLVSNVPKYIDVLQNRFLPGIADKLGIDPAAIDLAGRNIPGSASRNEAKFHVLDVIQRFTRAHCYADMPWREAQDAAGEH